MNTTIRLSGLALSLALPLWGCTQSATASMVSITLDEELQPNVQRVRVIVEGGPSVDALGGPTQEEINPDDLPILVPVIPRDRDTSRVYRVTAVAIGAAGELARARVIGGFAPGRVLSVPLHVYGGQCLTNDVCNLEQSCEWDGTCRPAFRDPQATAEYVAGDAGM